MKLIWATRGRTWGFRFLRAGGFEDPLPIYEEVFSKVGNEPRTLSWQGDTIVLRFPDPEGRKDRAGRVIPHEFIIFNEDDMNITSVDDGISLVWPLVSEEFARVWDAS